jgi:tetratricopeptide (TPR) repeat protein
MFSPQVLTNRSLAHMIRAKCKFAMPPVPIDDYADAADAGGDGGSLADQPALALLCAEQALLMRTPGATAAAEAVSECRDPAALINLATAMLMADSDSSERTGSLDADLSSPRTAAAANAAKTALMRALSLTPPREAPETYGRALLGLAGAHEALGETSEAAESLRKLLGLLSAPAEDGHAPPLAGEASGGLELAAGDACAAAADHAGALANFKRALRRSMA